MAMIKTLPFLAILLVCGCGPETSAEEAPAPTEVQSKSTPIPVILDTDIGTDIDDTWALAQLLALPDLDLKLVVTDSGDTTARARITAKFLEIAGRSDIPVGIGRKISDDPVPQNEWAADYDLEQYPGEVHQDGIGAMIDVIMQSPEPVTLIVIGPAPNIKDALEREPRIAERCRVVAMSGSVDVGYDGNSEPQAEYNVKQNIEGSKAMYTAAWDLTIAPLDTCGTIRLQGELYQKILASQKPAIKALLENYRIWARNINWTQVDPDQTSSVLFDTQAVAMVKWLDFYTVETVELAVTDDGFTRRTPGAKPVKAALKWIDKEGYEAWLASILTD